MEGGGQKEFCFILSENTNIRLIHGRTHSYVTRDAYFSFVTDPECSFVYMTEKSEKKI